MSLLQILAVVAGIGLLIFVHEFGHFLVAKLHGVRVDIFCLGFGPAICSWRKGGGFRMGSDAKEYEELKRRHQEALQTEREGTPREDPHALGEKLKALGQTEYRLAWIPLGGFVKMAGEPLGEERTGAPDELTSKSPGQRLQIFVAGTAMNFLVAFPICIFSFYVGRNLKVAQLGETPPPGSAEWDAGLTQGDRIVRVNGVDVDHLEAYNREILRAPENVEIPVEVLRGGQRLTVKLKPGGAEKLGVFPPNNIVDSVKSGSPAQQAGLQPGDVIEAIAGRPILTIYEIQRAVKPNAGKPLAFTVRRPATGETLQLTVTPALHKGPDANHALDLFEAAYEPFIWKIHPLSPAKDLCEGDRFTTINDEPARSSRQVQDAIEASPDQVVRYKVLRAASVKDLYCTARRDAAGRGTLDLLLSSALGGPEGVCALGDIPPGSPLAAAGARKGDRVLAFNGWTYTHADIEKEVQETQEKSVKLKIGRASAPPVEVDLPIEKGKDGKPSLPAQFIQAYPLLVEVPETWPLYAAGARSGDRVLRLDVDGDGTLDPCRSLVDLEKAAKRQKPFAVEVERTEKGPDGQESSKVLSLTVTPGTIPYGEIQMAPRLQTVFRRFSKRESVSLGVHEVFDMTKLTFQLLAKLFQGKGRMSDTAGPVGIFHVSYKVIQQGVGNFLWLLGLITVSLSIFNLFPIPILDGGHILFLLVEKIKGSPVSEKTQTRAQYVGLFLLLALLIYVTTNDISRFFP